MTNKAVIWGHKLTTPDKSHTHSFVHQAFFDAFKHMGYETVWLDNSDNVDSDSLSNSIFLTEGQVDSKIPIRKDCKYVLHNCNLDKYQSILPNTLNLQVYTYDCLARKVEKLSEPLTYYQPDPVDTEQVGCNNRTLYQTWATNLLPHQILKVDAESIKRSRMKVVFWVGSIYGGWQGNVEELKQFSEACFKHGVVFNHTKLPEDIRHVKAIQHSWVSPAIQGNWQVDKGYVPCRVYKNISYGRIPGTNSNTVSELFGGKLPYSKDMQELLNLSEAAELASTQESLDALMDEVRQNHTYVNRIKTILKVL